MRTERKLKAAIVLAVVAAAVPFGIARSSAAVAHPTPSPTATPDEMSGLRELYRSNCAECHKDSGKGGSAVVNGREIDAEDLTNSRMAKRSDAKLYDEIAEGAEDEGMPAFRGKLSESQINGIIRYIRTELQHAK